MNTKLNLDTIVQRNESNAATTEIENTIIILHIENGKYYSLNRTSSDLWYWLEQPISVTALRDKIMAKYNCSHDIANHDVLFFLQRLSDINLLLIK